MNLNRPDTVPFDVLRVVLTYVMFGLGVILILPWDTFSQSNAWRLFVASGITEPQCGLVLLSIGAVGLVGLATRDRKLRAVTTIVLAVAHLALAILFCLGSPTGAAVIPYTGYVVLGLTLLACEAAR